MWGQHGAVLGLRGTRQHCWPTCPTRQERPRPGQTKSISRHDKCPGVERAKLALVRTAAVTLPVGGPHGEDWLLQSRGRPGAVGSRASDHPELVGTVKMTADTGQHRSDLHVSPAHRSLQSLHSKASVSPGFASMDPTSSNGNSAFIWSWESADGGANCVRFLCHFVYGT